MERQAGLLRALRHICMCKILFLSARAFICWLNLVRDFLFEKDRIVQGFS